jgi:hypothetical protein
VDAVHRITCREVKPIEKVQWKFQATYIYGVVKPEIGEHLFDEFTHLNSQCLQIFLEVVAQRFPESVLIIQLDNVRFHKAKKLKIPNNIIVNVSAVAHTGIKPNRWGVAVSKKRIEMGITKEFR